MKIDYYFTCASPWSFLGLAAMREITGRHGATVVAHPVNYGTIFPASGGLPLPRRAPQRQAYRMMELRRWRRFRDLPLVLEPRYFPVDDALANRMLLAARTALPAGAGHEPVLDLAQAFHELLWLQDGNIADPQALADCAAARGADGPGLRAAAQGEAIIDRYDADTSAAIAAGVFGAPTYVLDGELFWGQDRVEFLDRALSDKAGS